LNDSLVSRASFHTLGNITSTFPSDVAYLLFYRLVEDDILYSNQVSSAAGDSTSRIDLSLLSTINADNSNYLNDTHRPSFDQSPDHIYTRFRQDDGSDYYDPDM